ncbi:receptor-type tyrosine-protein phosphatase alpha-like [Acanthaster planci]|uniref:Receptor-type tyrosine-protein phosphatase alpha-like n=1 Tax=Acanthaster planci TaxID=133434 RepID=A0A8B7Z7Q0_ACAPL|nr:receptor-type tyrosine-protein phosphatase alpha-like [Acanthaster planci]
MYHTLLTETVGKNKQQFEAFVVKIYIDVHALQDDIKMEYWSINPSFTCSLVYVFNFFLHLFFSAGVGRTGTYICLDSVLQQMNQEGQVDVLGFIYRMRQKRIMIVHTSAQCQFIFDAFLAASLTGETTNKIANFRRQLTTMKNVQGRSKETGTEKQLRFASDI